MTMQLTDRKSSLTYSIFGTLNRIALRLRFKQLAVAGRENIPAQGPFLMVANHISRWDGLLLYGLIDRPSNFMVSPNELRGLQGHVLRSMGAFPADPRTDLVNFVLRQADGGQGTVVFPEGDVFRDGVTHPFKSGASRIALCLARAGVPVSVIPVALNYPEDYPELAQVQVGSPIKLDPYINAYDDERAKAVCSLTTRLYREVCMLRGDLGCTADLQAMYAAKPTRSWVPQQADSAL